MKSGSVLFLNTLVFEVVDYFLVFMVEDFDIEGRVRLVYIVTSLVIVLAVVF